MGKLKNDNQKNIDIQRLQIIKVTKYYILSALAGFLLGAIYSKRIINIIEKYNL